MAWFGQGKDTVEWEEFRDDVLFYKWPAKELKKGSRLIIRAGQNAIFYANGAIEGVFKDPGNFDIATQITPFLSTLKGIFTLRGDTGLRAEVYLVNAKELLLPWGTRQRIMIPSPQAPAGIPIGANGNVIIEFRDYLTFINKIAGVKATYSLGDISERIMGELNPIISECILDGQQALGASALIALQGNSRKLAKKMAEELDKELLSIGMGVADLNILALNYPKEVQAMADKAAAQSFVGDVNRYAAINMADSFNNPAGNNMAAMGAQMAMGAQLAGSMFNNQQQHTNPTPNPQPAQAGAQGDRFCPTCRKMVGTKFCPECGSQTV